jgi:hypothetical protein
MRVRCCEAVGLVEEVARCTDVVGVEREHGAGPECTSLDGGIEDLPERRIAFELIETGDERGGAPCTIVGTGALDPGGDDLIALPRDVGKLGRELDDCRRSACASGS